MKLCAPMERLLKQIDDAGGELLAYRTAHGEAGDAVNLTTVRALRRAGLIRAVRLGGGRFKLTRTARAA